MKVRILIYIVFIVFLNSNIAKSEVTKSFYELNLKVLGFNVKIGEINSVFEINSENYYLEYDLKSENLVELISPINGSGKIYGKYLESKLIPQSYIYEMQRKGKKKYTKIEFLNSNVKNYEVNPPYEKSKLTPINDAMLLNVIDPSTGIVLMSDFKLNKKCTIDYKIFDGKRRYDLIYTNVTEVKNYKICTLKRNKLGGFKNDGDNVDNNPFSAEQIDAFFVKKNNNYIIEKFITKNKSTELIINVTIQ